MRKLFLLTTSLFWVAVVAIAVSGTSTSGTAPQETTGNLAESSAENHFTLAEVADHAVEKDCWMVIDGVVYDFTAYLPDHPTRPDIILPWCGKEASEAYKTKTRGRPHSSGADSLLPDYRIGLIK